LCSPRATMMDVAWLPPQTGAHERRHTGEDQHMRQTEAATVLLVDDEPRLRTILCKVLESSGYECVAACDGVEAVECLKSAQFDLVFTDLEMPRMRGLELIQHMRDGKNATPVIIMTGHAEFDLAREALRLNVADYIVKPVESLDVIVTAAKRAIAQGVARAAPEMLVEELGNRLASDAQIPGSTLAEGLSGKEIGGFRVQERIGEGRMGVVYKALQLSMNRQVALKALHSALVADQGFVARFVNEARAAARLNHPNLVRGIDAGSHDGVYYFAMELVNGISAAQRLERDGALLEIEVASIGIQMARALSHAWSAGLVHRDVTPSNILLSNAGTALLADLGIARDTRSESPAVTVDGTSLGTPLYMAPEQILRASQVDGRTDIYGLGCTLYHLLTGVAPFLAPTPVEVLAMHLRDKPEPAFSRRPEASLEMSSVIAKMMSKAPENRYADAEDLAEDLQLVADGSTPLHASLIS
jgi:CheY-like chemotaxis protein